MQKNKSEKKPKTIIHQNINTYIPTAMQSPGGTSPTDFPWQETDIDKVMRYKPMGSIEATEDSSSFTKVFVWDPKTKILFWIWLGWTWEYTTSNPFLIWYNKPNPATDESDWYIIKKWWVYHHDVWLVLLNIDNITKVMVRVVLYQWPTVIDLLDYREIKGKDTNLVSDISAMASCGSGPWNPSACISWVLQPIITNLANRQRLDYIFDTIPVRLSKKSYIPRDPLYKDPGTPLPYTVCVDIEVLGGVGGSVTLWQWTGNHFQLERLKQSR